MAQLPPVHYGSPRHTFSFLGVANGVCVGMHQKGFTIASRLLYLSLSRARETHGCVVYHASGCRVVDPVNIEGL